MNLMGIREKNRNFDEAGECTHSSLQGLRLQAASRGVAEICFKGRTHRRTGGWHGSGSILLPDGVVPAEVVEK